MKMNELHGGLPNGASAADAPGPASAAALWEQASRYQLDLWQRGILFLDILRERADNMLAHEQAGQRVLRDHEALPDDGRVAILPPVSGG